MVDIFAAIKRDLRQFSGRDDADDDITMIGLKLAAIDQALLADGRTA